VVAAVLLLLALLGLLAGTGLLWWTAGRLEARYKVVSKAVPVPLTPLGMPPLVHALVFCDVHDNCTSIYQETQVNISGKFLRTWPCQSVALTLVLDPACLQYSSFSSLLPVLRILLPLLAALLLPALLHLCVGLQGQAHLKRHTRKHMTSRTSWSGLEEPCYQPALPPTDPVLHYKEMCLPLDARGRMVHRPASTHAIAAVSPAPADASLQPLFTSTLQVPGMDASTFSSPGAMAASTPRASAEEGEGRLYSTVERPAGLSTFQRTPRRHSRDPRDTLPPLPCLPPDLLAQAALGGRGPPPPPPFPVPEASYWT